MIECDSRIPKYLDGFQVLSIVVFRQIEVTKGGNLGLRSHRRHMTGDGVISATDTKIGVHNTEIGDTLASEPVDLILHALQRQFNDLSGQRPITESTAERTPPVGLQHPHRKVAWIGV